VLHYLHCLAHASTIRKTHFVVHIECVCVFLAWCATLLASPDAWLDTTKGVLSPFLGSVQRALCTCVENTYSVLVCIDETTHHVPHYMHRLARDSTPQKRCSSSLFGSFQRALCTCVEEHSFLECTCQTTRHVPHYLHCLARDSTPQTNNFPPFLVVYTGLFVRVSNIDIAFRKACIKWFMMCHATCIASRVTMGCLWLVGSIKS